MADTNFINTHLRKFNPAGSAPLNPRSSGSSKPKATYEDVIIGGGYMTVRRETTPIPVAEPVYVPRPAPIATSVYVAHPIPVAMASRGCVFRCGGCRPDEPHTCKMCGALNSHRSNGCPLMTVYTAPVVSASRGCIYGCGVCRPGEPHKCKICGALNSHRSNVCPFITAHPHKKKVTFFGEGSYVT